MSKLIVSIDKSYETNEHLISVNAECPCDLSLEDCKKINSDITAYISSLILKYVIKNKYSNN